MKNRVHAPANLILSAGTQVVTLVDILSKNGRTLHPVGAVGVIAKSPADTSEPYLVRFTDGFEESLLQNQLVMLAKFKEGELAGSNQLRNDNLFDRAILRVVIGSRAYGLDDENSDIDYRGVFLPTASRHWSLAGVPEQIECHETQEVYWELQKFVVLALKGNPNILECLNSPLVEKVTPLGQQLLDLRDIFLSKLIYQTFNGYAMSQFKKMNRGIRNHQSPKPKHVMHLLRLLICGAQTLRTGTLNLSAGKHRDRLLQIKRGEMPWEESEAWRKQLQQEFVEAFAATSLPDRPDYDRANDFLISARHAALADELP